MSSYLRDRCFSSQANFPALLRSLLRQDPLLSAFGSVWSINGLSFVIFHQINESHTSPTASSLHAQPKTLPTLITRSLTLDASSLPITLLLFIQGAQITIHTRDKLEMQPFPWIHSSVPHISDQVHGYQGP